MTCAGDRADLLVAQFVLFDIADDVTRFVDAVGWQQRLRGELCRPLRLVLLRGMRLQLRLRDSSRNLSRLLGLSGPRRLGVVGILGRGLRLPGLLRLIFRASTYFSILSNPMTLLPCVSKSPQGAIITWAERVTPTSSIASLRFERVLKTPIRTQRIHAFHDAQRVGMRHLIAFGTPVQHGLCGRCHLILVAGQLFGNVIMRGDGMRAVEHVNRLDIVDVLAREIPLRAPHRAHTVRMAQNRALRGGHHTILVIERHRIVRVHAGFIRLHRRFNTCDRRIMHDHVDEIDWIHADVQQRAASQRRIGDTRLRRGRIAQIRVDRLHLADHARTR